MLLHASYSYSSNILDKKFNSVVLGSFNHIYSGCLNNCRDIYIFSFLLSWDKSLVYFQKQKHKRGQQDAQQAKVSAAKPNSLS